MFGPWKYGRRCQRDSQTNVPHTTDEPPANCRYLADVAPGTCCRIRRHRGRGPVRQRLLDLGFVPTATVCVLRKATLGDPIELLVADTFITLRKDEAAQIEVDPQ